MPKTKLKKSLSKGILTYFFIGLLLIFTSIAWNIYQTRVLSFNQIPAQILIPKKISSPKPPAEKIIVKKLGINLPITESLIKNGAWEINPSGGSHLNGSANPGEGGNIILYGHNKKELFGSVVALKVNDQIKIISQDKIEHVYKVIETKTVNPSDIYVLSPTADETLTFYTCVGLLDSKRFVVIAKPLVYN
jgi:LPXTG-site transpeptidase (sortase) family protein